jgi:hypothetical protein
MAKKTSFEIHADKVYNKWRHPNKKKKQKKHKTDFQLELNILKTKDYAAFLKSRYWRFVRTKILIRDGYKCTVCESNKELQIHHTTYKNHFKEHKHLSDLLTLCGDCHKEYHNTVEIAELK